MKQQIRLTESQLNRVIKESVTNVLNEREFNNVDDYYAEFYDAVLKSNSELYRALTFVSGEMKNDALVKKVNKISQSLNEVAYFIEQRQRG